ncbi:SDR family NAD(P)-dependent oxidoreductase [Paenibacillus sp. CAU 1782]
MSNETAGGNSVYLVTGAAGFIGSFVSKRLLEDGATVIGIDNLNDYYDPKLKHARLELLKQQERFVFVQGDISDKTAVTDLFRHYKPEVVVHLAAQAGVRYSLENPDAYIQSNIVGFHHILEACREFPVKHLLYASSSSVYGANRKVPFEESDPVDHPVSLYAATKKSNELMAHTYSHLYRIPATGLRFFTVYGPMGRPDMAYFGFADSYFAGRPIAIYNNGDFENDLYRDFTYIDDIVDGIIRLIGKPPVGTVAGAVSAGMAEDDATTPVEAAKTGGAGAPHKVYNIGNNSPEKLMAFIGALETALGKALGREVVFAKQFEPIKPGDVPATYASTDALYKAVGFKPQTPISEGLQRFADWYVGYYGVK